MKDFRAILKQYWGYDDFRGIQREIIESISAGHDTLGLMPTGGGKSITFQVPALAMEGMCLVISPLISLMKDQVANLRRHGILAQAIYTGMTHEEVVVTLHNCVYGAYKFLYISPERLGSELFQSQLRLMDISFIAVDEAHCISQWGYDFRPAYTQIADVRRLVPHAAVLALTATATPDVVKDIQRQLLFKQENVFKMSFARDNLVYNVRRADRDIQCDMLDILVAHPGPAIIYTRSREKTEQIATMLRDNGITAAHYHAGLQNHTKSNLQKDFQEGRLRVMVATNAFGMGIDKADVRTVVHVDVPDSPEAYFQEAGRAGRDGALAYAILLTDSRSTATLRRRIEDTFPPVDYIRRVYQDVCFFLQMAMGDGEGVTREFDLQLFCRNFRHHATRAYNAIQLLERAGYLQWIDPEEGRSRVMFTKQRDELYAIDDLRQADDRVMYHLLRNYTGLFSQEAYINEVFIAEDLAMAEEDVSQALINLSRAHIIRFIPRKFIPRITFVKRRLELDELIFPPNIYAERKQQLAHRIETMIEYVETNECHSQFLLRYFGEDNAQKCGRCNNCTGDDEAMLTVEAPDLRQRITELLRHKGPMPVYEICFTGIPRRQVAQVLHDMFIDEEVTCYDDATIVGLCQH